MTAMMKRWYRSRRNQIITFIIILFCIVYYISLNDSLHREPDLDVTRSLNLTTLAPDKLKTGNGPVLNLKTRKSVIEYIETKLEQALQEDKGTGCVFPQLDPFAKEVTQFDKEVPDIVCEGRNWVKCYLSECRVVKEILETTRNIECNYRDIIYENDSSYKLGSPTPVRGGGAYTLRKSDHVKVKCVGIHTNDILPSKWTGLAVGFRTEVERRKPPVDRPDAIDVLIFGFDSTSRNGFIRKMPKSYKYITEELGAVVLNGYNIVGDGTPAALFPILTGKTELELPDVRKKSKYKGSLDDMPFIFYKLKEEGYRTAYFEDMPWIGTFQYRFKGFKRQPADHYLRPFYLEEYTSGVRWHRSKTQRYCVGDTMNYKLMMNITEQFFKLDGNHFAFTFIADITHDDSNMIALADADTARFLGALNRSGRLQKTLLIVMGDHGPRFANVRNTLQGKFEERMPLMAIRLPEVLKEIRPEVAAILASNANVLTTPHDIHATVLDAMGLDRYWNDYRIKGTNLTRGMTLFQPIPRTRSCSEAGIEPHWCACVAWSNVSRDERVYRRLPPAFLQYINELTQSVSEAGIEPHWCACVAWSNVSRDERVYRRLPPAFLQYINELTQSVRSKCEPRTLTSVAWVSRRRANSNMLRFAGNRDADGYVGKFNPNVRHDKEYYQIKVEVGPGHGVYEASAVHLVNEDRFEFDTRDISRTNAYNDEPSCISATHPHLNMYCYCKEFLTK